MGFMDYVVKVLNSIRQNNEIIIFLHIVTIVKTHSEHSLLA